MPVLWALDGDLVTLTFEGEYTFEEIAEAARRGLEGAPAQVRLLVDATPTARLPDSQGVRQRVGLLRELADRLAGPVAIVASAGAMYGIARQIGQQAESVESLNVRVFERLGEARGWLDRGALDD